MATRRDFLKTIGGIVAGVALAPFAVKSAVRRVYGGVYFREDGVKVYSGSHYDRIDVMPGERVLIADTVETIGTINVRGGHLLASDCRYTLINTINVLSGSVGVADGYLRGTISNFRMGMSDESHRITLVNESPLNVTVRHDFNLPRRTTKKLFDAALAGLA